MTAVWKPPRTTTGWGHDFIDELKAVGIALSLH